MKSKKDNQNEGGEQESRTIFKTQIKSEKKAVKSGMKQSILVDYSNEDEI